MNIRNHAIWMLSAVVLSAMAPLSAALYPDFGRVEGLDFAEIGPEEYRPLRRELRAFHPRECHEPPKSAAALSRSASRARFRPFPTAGWPRRGGGWT